MRIARPAKKRFHIPKPAIIKVRGSGGLNSGFNPRAVMGNNYNKFHKNSPTATNIEGALHVDRYLTNFSVMFVQDSINFIAQRAASIIPVVKQTDLFVQYDRGYFWRDEAKPRPLGGRPQQVGYKIESDSYACVEYALEHVVDDRQRANADEPIRLDENATTLLTQKNMIKQDRTWCQRFFVTGVWTTDVTGVHSTPGANQITQFSQPDSEPIEVIDQYKDVIAERTGYMPNTLVLGADVKRALRSHPDISDRIKYTQVGIADDGILASLFEVENVITARSVYTTSNEGATNAFDFIADQDAMWLGYIEPNPTVDSPTAIAMFTWTGLIPGQTNQLGGVIERGRDDRAHSDYFQGRMAWDMKRVSADLGVFFDNVVD
jgi:hypothetical protein